MPIVYLFYLTSLPLTLPLPRSTLPPFPPSRQASLFLSPSLSLSIFQSLSLSLSVSLSLSPSLSLTLSPYFLSINNYFNSSLPLSSSISLNIFLSFYVSSSLFSEELWLSSRGSVCPIRGCPMRILDLVADDDLKNRSAEAGLKSLCSVSLFLALSYTPSLFFLCFFLSLCFSLSLSLTLSLSLSLTHSLSLSLSLTLSFRIKRYHIQQTSMRTAALPDDDLYDF